MFLMNIKNSITYKNEIFGLYNYFNNHCYINDNIKINLIYNGFYTNSKFIDNNNIIIFDYNIYMYINYIYYWIISIIYIIDYYINYILRFNIYNNFNIKLSFYNMIPYNNSFYYFYMEVIIVITITNKN